MKILSVHIAGFGRFQNEDLTFNDGLNVIFHENGWGKTTLCAFIKAMFYGLPAGGGKDSLEENDRKMYAPLGGGSFGGSIEFVSDGKHFRIERTFGKSSTFDTCVLHDLTGNKTYEKEPPVSWGGRLFSVSVDAFVRTLFLGQKDIDLSDKTSVYEKIGNVYQGESDTSLDKAIQKLDEIRKDLKHNKGRGGKIDETNDRIYELNTMADAALSAAKGVPFLESDLQKLNDSYNAVQKQLEETKNLSRRVREVGAVKDRAESLKQKEDERREISEKISVSERFFGGRVPTESEFLKIGDLISTVKTTENDVEKAKEKRALFEKDKHEISSSYKRVPTTENVSDFERLVLTEKQMLRGGSSLGVSVSAAPTKKGGLTAVSVLLGALLAVGVALGFILSPYWFILAAVAFFSEGFVLTYGLLKKATLLNVPYERERDILERENTVNVTRIQTQIVLLLTSYGLEDLSPETALEKMKADAERLATLSGRIEYADAEIREKSEILEDVSEKVNAFLSGFSFGEKEKANATERFSYAQSVYKALSSDRETDERLIREIASLKEKGVELDNELLSANVQKLDENERVLTEKLQELSREIAKKSRDLADTKDAQDRYVDILETKAKAEDDLKLYKEKYDTVVCAMEYIEKARASLSSRYQTPILEGVQNYLRSFGAMDFRLNMDADYTCQVELSGSMSSPDRLSRGWKNLFDFALRLAFIDQIVKTVDGKELPFLVLDDPFVHFDKDKIRDAKAILSELAKNRQILYFTCHESRLPD